MKVKAISSTLITVFRYDEVPIGKLLHPKFAQLMSSLFSFTDFQTLPPEIGDVTIRFRRGLIERNDTAVIIERIDLGERKMVIQVKGGTETANEVFSKVADFLSDLNDDTDIALMDPLITTYESNIIAQLDFSIYELLDSDYWDFLNRELVDAAKIVGTSVQVFPLELRFAVRFQVTDPEIIDHKITVTEKVFSLEPRMGSLLDEKLYHSKAPIDSESHIKLLSNFESIVANRI